MVGISRTKVHPAKCDCKRVLKPRTRKNALALMPGCLLCNLIQMQTLYMQRHGIEHWLRWTALHLGIAILKQSQADEIKTCLHKCSHVLVCAALNHLIGSNNVEPATLGMDAHHMALKAFHRIRLLKEKKSLMPASFVFGQLHRCSCVHPRGLPRMPNTAGM